MNRANPPSCEACYADHAQLKVQPPCGGCPKPFIEENNIVAWEIFVSLSSQMKTAGMGEFIGYDLQTLPFLFQVFQVPESEWIFYLEKVEAVIRVAVKYLTKKDEPKGK